MGRRENRLEGAVPGMVLKIKSSFGDLVSTVLQNSISGGF